MEKEISVSKGELKSLEVNNVWRAIIQLYTERKAATNRLMLDIENVYDMKRLQGELREIEFFLSLPDRFTEEIDIEVQDKKDKKDKKDKGA